MRLRLPLLALVATLAGLSSGTVTAQFPLAFPQEGTEGLWVLGGPFGSSTNGGNDEVRTHLLIPATHLPTTAGDIVGLEVLPGASGSVLYRSLEIDLGHRGRGAGPLVPNLTSNLVGVRSGTVFTTSNRSVDYTRSRWHRFDFNAPAPFRYNGTDDLLLEVRKWANGRAGVVNMRMHHETASILRTVPGPRGLGRMHFTKGATGSGALQGTQASEESMPLRLRLIFASGATLAVSSRPTSIRTEFALGTAVDVTLHAPAGTAYLTLLQAAPNPLHGFVNAPGTTGNIDGRFWVLGSPTFSGVVGPGASSATQPLPLPYAPVLINYHFALQSVAALPGGRVLWTNACDFVVHP